MTTPNYSDAERELRRVEEKEAHPDRRSVVCGLNVYGEPMTCEYQRDPSLYCPRCATRSVWFETGDGDYYVGVEYRCATCGATFRDAPGEPTDNDRKIAEQLR